MSSGESSATRPVGRPASPSGRNGALHFYRAEALSHSRGLGKGCSIIRREFLDALARKLVLYIERVPRLPQVKLFVWDRFTGGLVLKLVVGHWKVLVRPQLQDFRRHSCKLGFQ